MADKHTDEPAGKSTDSENKTPENPAGKEDLVANMPPGSMIGVDWSKTPALELKESHISALRSLLTKLTRLRDMPARREEILRVWESSLFFRGFQHLLPSRMGFGWDIGGPSGSGYGPGEAGYRSEFDVNFYLIYGLSVISALTRKIPTVRFEAVCPKEDADLTAASAANKLVSMIHRNNNMLSLMSDMARFLWTDARVSFYTRYVKDGQRWGFGEPEEPENPEEASAEEAEEGGKPAKKTKGDPRGMVVTTCHGALEVKYPIKANSQAECGYLLWSREVDVSVAKGMFPKKMDKIMPTMGGTAGDDVDRLARVNTKLGVQDNFVTSDSQQYDVTVQNGWLRDCSLLEIDDQQTRDELLEMSDGKGLRITFCGQEFIEAKQESMDDHWVLCFALPGDGMHRPALGSSYIPMQKNVNTLYELRQDYLIRGIPIKFMDSEMFDVENLSKQQVTPGDIKPFTADPMRPATDFIFVEPTIQFPQGLEEAIEDMGRGQSAQLMTGVFPALSGSDDVGAVGETASGLAMQRDAALGRIGIPYRYIKEAIANVTLQEVQCLAENHDGDIFASGSKHGGDPVVVELQDLKGKFYCTPDTDENFPASYTEIQNRVSELMLESQANPALLDIVNDPGNFGFLKRATGLQELYIPKQASSEKQLGEIEDMKRSGPLPNPAFADLQKKIQTAPPADGQDPQMDAQVRQQLAALKQQAQAMPQQISSVEVDPDLDDHETEAAVCIAFLRSPNGRALKAGTTEEQEAFLNIKLHFMEHQKLAQQLAKQNQQTPQRAVSKSINAGDLIKAGMSQELAQLLGEANIQSSGQAPAPQVPPQAPPAA